MLTFFCLNIIISFYFIDCSLKFNIPMFRDKCFLKEIYISGTLLVRYDLSGFEESFKAEEQKELFENIKIFIKNEKGYKMYETNMKSRKDKFALFLNESGNYQICTRYYRPRRGKDLPSSVLMGLKIKTDYDFTELEGSIHKEDVHNFWAKIRQIKKEIYPSIQAEKIEIEEEDKTAKSIISSVQIYHLLCFIQLLIIILITAFTLCNYKRYFRSKTII